MEKKAQKFLKNDNNCFSIKSVFGYLIEKKAINLFLGVDYKNSFYFYCMLLNKKLE